MKYFVKTLNVTLKLLLYILAAMAFMIILELFWLVCNW